MTTKGPAAVGEPVRRDRVDIVATVLLAFAAVATAWSSYQANRWNGEPTKASGRVNALRIDATRSQGLAEGQTQVDIAMFSSGRTPPPPTRAHSSTSTQPGSDPSSARPSTPGWPRTRS